MKWPGIRDDTTTIGEGLLSAQNVSYFVDGELRRRSALADRLDAGGQLVIEHNHPVAGNSLVAFTTGGALTGTSLAGGATTTLKSGMNATFRGCFAKHNGRVYFTNDFDKPQVIERADVACANAGIPAPTTTMGAPSTSAGSVDIGAHLVRFRYLNSKTGYVSNPSVAITVTVATTTKTLTFTIGAGLNIEPSTDSKVDTVVVEMTGVNGITYYRAGTALNTAASIAISITDANLFQQIATDTYHGDFGHEPPPLCAIMGEHRGRVFFFGATERSVSSVSVTNASATVTGTGFSPNWAGRLMLRTGDTTPYVILSVNAGGTSMTLTQVYAGTTSAGGATITVYSPAPDTLFWSRSGYPEATKQLEWARRVLQNQGDKPSGMASFYGDLYLFGQRTCRVLDYVTDPATGKLVNIPGDMGVWNQHCLVEANGQLYGWCRSGAWVIDGILPKHISAPIDITDDALIDYAQFEDFHGIYDPRERVIQWFFVRIGETDPKDAIALDIDSGVWSMRRYRHAVLASTLATKTAEPVRALVSDDNVKSWYLEQDRIGDGVPTSITSGILTVASASSTVITTNETVLTADVVGAVLYRVSTAEAKYITANTASTFTTTAWGTTVTAAETFWIGPITVSLQLKWWTGDGLKTKKRPSYLTIGSIPGTSAGKLTVSIYQDFSVVPVTLTSYPSDTRNDGISFNDQGTSFTVDNDGGSGDGYVTLPLSADWKRAVSALVTSSTPVDNLRLIDLMFAMEDPRSEVVEDAE